MRKNYGIKAEWHFFATSHGKGPCDGIGGTLKRLADEASLQRIYENQILTAKQVYDWAIGRSTESTMYYEYCAIEEFDNSTKAVASYWKVGRVPGTRDFHAFIPLDENTINCKFNSASEESQSFKLL